MGDSKQREILKIVNDSITTPKFSLVQSLSCVRLFAAPWTSAYQAPPSMGFASQEYWSGVPSLSPIFCAVLCLVPQLCLTLRPHGV